MKNTILALFLICSLIGQTSARPWVDPELQSPSLMQSNAWVTLILRFKNPIERSLHSLSPHNLSPHNLSPHNLSPHNLSPQKLQKHKMDSTQESQAEFLSFLESRRLKMSQVQSATSLWINNSLILRARISFLKNLTQRQDITHIHKDRSFMLSPDLEMTREEETPKPTLSYGIKRVQAHRVWTNFGISGKGVTVGVLDTGWSDHLELTGRVIASKDFISSYEDNAPSDDHGHGSHVLGTIGGRNLSGTHIGVAPNVKFLVAKIFSDLGYTNDSTLLKAMQWIADPDGNPETRDCPRVISNSWGRPRGSDKQERPIWDAVQAWIDLGIFPVFAAGNAGPDKSTISTPASYPHSFAVGATNSWSFVMRSSSRGPAIWGSRQWLKPDLMAPGKNILSLDHKGGYKKLSGTSMATPHVAGVLALMFQAQPQLSVPRARQILERSASGALSNKYGHGLINAYWAVDLALRGNLVEVHVNSGEVPATIKVSPADHVYKTDIHGLAQVSLPAGKFELYISAFGFESEKIKLKLEEHDDRKMDITLKPASFSTVNFQVQNTEGELVEAEVNFPGIPVASGSTTGKGLSRSFPRGSSYKATVLARGYRPLKIGFEVKKRRHSFVFKLQNLAQVLLVDDDYANDSTSLFQGSLVDSGHSFEVMKNEEGIEAMDLMAFPIVIWYCANTSMNTLSPEERVILRNYVESGGRLLVSGQDIGFDIGNSDFYHEVFGAKFVADDAGTEIVKLGERLFSLKEGDNLHYQRSPDLIATVPGNAKVLLNYKDGGPAGLANSYGNGKVIYLAFGLEAVDGAEARTSLLRYLISALKPGLDDKIQRIQNAYEENSALYQALYQVLIQNFVFPEELSNAQRMKILNSTGNIEPFRPILNSLFYGR
jgi:subtilisin family serine protease